MPKTRRGARSTDCSARSSGSSGAIGSRLVGGGRVFYRTADGIETASRDEFVEQVKRGEVAEDDAGVRHGRQRGVGVANAFRAAGRVGVDGALFRLDG